MGKTNIKIKMGGNSMHSISHTPFIKKPSLMQNFTLFARYFRINEYAVYSNEQA
jgi:hypothetical protein